MTTYQLSGEQLLEALADQEHARWSGWMEYMLGCGRVTDDGDWLMPKEKLERWTRQMRTPYAALSEPERESDRTEARNTLALLATLTPAPEPAGELQKHAEEAARDTAQRIRAWEQASGERLNLDDTAFGGFAVQYEGPLVEAAKQQAQHTFRDAFNAAVRRLLGEGQKSLDGH